jgi:hypothetical protein
MRKTQLLLALLLSTFLFSCSKDEGDDAQPDYAAEITGHYKGVRMVTDGSNIPLGTVAKWDIDISHQAYQTVSMAQTSQTFNNQPSTITMNDIKVSKAGNVYYMDNFLRIGEYDGDTLTVYFSNQSEYVKAVKQ